MPEIYRMCSVEGCVGKFKAKGYCSAHHARFQKYGDPLGGRPTMDGDLMRFIEEVAVPYKGKDCLIWPYARHGKGYGTIKIEGKSTLVHRYVCRLAHGEPPTESHDAAHNCGKGHLACVNPNHLEWKTRAENMADKVTHGTSNRGERSGSAKLTEAQAREIIRLKGSKTCREIAEQFGVKPAAIVEIHRGRNWAWLQPDTETANLQLDVVHRTRKLTRRL